MKRQWHIRREFKAHPDGQQRWGRAYQYLLQWTQNRVPMQNEASATKDQPQEVQDENCSLCASINLTAGASTDH